MQKIGVLILSIVCCQCFAISFGCNGFRGLLESGESAKSSMVSLGLKIEQFTHELVAEAGRDISEHDPMEVRIFLSGEQNEVINVGSKLSNLGLRPRFNKSDNSFDLSVTSPIYLSDILIGLVPEDYIDLTSFNLRANAVVIDMRN